MSCEIKAAQIYLKRGWEWQAHRYKTPFAEVDLIFYSPRVGLVLVEVKSYNQSWAEEALSRSQKERLQRARFYLQEKFQQPVQLHLAVFQKNHRPSIFTRFD